jgi:serine phosphatase RsbU (regulator of sigma subunit)
MPSLTIITSQGVTAVVPLKREVFVIGRSKDADLWLHDEGVSRQHAHLERAGETYVLVDLESRNGTSLNDKRLTQPTPLSPGDRIRIGQTLLLYREEDAPSATGSVRMEADDPQFQASVFKADQLPYTRFERGLEPDDTEAHHPLVRLNQVSRDLLTLKDEQAVAQFLARSVLDWFAGDCCAVVYHQPSEDGYRLEIRAMACADAGALRNITISSTAARQVIEQQMAFFSTNAPSDERLMGHQSVVSRGITAILCAPLWHEDRVFGLLYLDTTEPGVRFSVDHLGLLSAVANLAAIKIDNLRLFEAAMAKLALDKELALAAQIQTGLLPGERMTFGDLRCFGFNHACSQIGGDYFDFIPLSDEILTVTIADVSGHGTVAALLMAGCKSMLTALIDAGMPLQERMVRLNRYLLKHSALTQFITVFHGEIDRQAGILRYCNAGHNAPILLAPDGTTDLLAPFGIPFGIMDTPYEVRTAPFARGARLVLFTDGVTETRNAAMDEYGEARLLDLVRAHRASPAPVVRDTILDAIEAFAGGVAHQDDVTLAIVERAGPDA